jgi:signal transduction histidine kinase
VRVPISSAKDDLDFVGEHVNATVDHLKRAVEALAQVSSDIAHDLKTPIARIQQRIETALAASQTADDYRATLSDIKNDVSGVITTFEAILRIAQIEGGARKSRFVATDLAEVLTRVMEAYEYVGDDTNHRITLASLPAQPMIIHGDSQLLTQLFANLIENAIRHTPPGSRIDVASKRTGSSIEIAVRDNGPGIPKEERENVFRRLYRLDKSRTDPGSGLGLSLVAAITTLHDAQIALEDNQPGLIVRLTFPADHGSRLTSASHPA